MSRSLQALDHRPAHLAKPNKAYVHLKIPV
jgi:hypothetical protein